MELAKKLIQKDFLFSTITSSDFSSLLPFLILFGGLVVLTVLSLFLFKNINPIAGKIKAKANAWMLSLGLVGLLVVFFRWQQLSFLSKNFILELMGVIWFIWLIIILNFTFRGYPKEFSEYQEKQRIAKYLPRHKNKRKQK